jgi:hypothetical protein
LVNATPRPLYPRERPGPHCRGDWLGSRAGLDSRGNSRPHHASLPGPSNLQRVAIPTELSRPIFVAKIVLRVCRNAKLYIHTLPIVFKRNMLYGSGEPVTGICECGNETKVSMKQRVFCVQLSDLGFCRWIGFPISLSYPK